MNHVQPDFSTGWALSSLDVAGGDAERCVAEGAGSDAGRLGKTVLSGIKCIAHLASIVYQSVNVVSDSGSSGCHRATPIRTLTYLQLRRPNLRAARVSGFGFRGIMTS